MEALKGITILVVDDEELIQELFVDEFTMHGANVLCAGNGQFAFEILKKNKIDVIISDVRMPICDGKTFFQNIKTHIPSPPKLFICSGYNDITKKDLDDLNVVAVFPKPFDHENMLKIILSSLNKN